MTPHERLKYADSQDRGQVVLDILNEVGMTSQQRADLLAKNWTVCEAWGKDLPAALDWLERLAPFGIGDALPDVDEDGMFTIYRATGGDEPTEGSWTLSVDVAEQFAHMICSPRGMFLGIYAPEPIVWKAQVARADILAYFENRGEQEVVTRKPVGVVGLRQLRAAKR